MAIITTQSHHKPNSHPAPSKMACPLFVWLFSITGSWLQFDDSNQLLIEDLWERGTHYGYVCDSHFNNVPVLVRLDTLNIELGGAKLNVVRVLR